MPEPGLRERKKVRTRSAIQHHALRLVREQGYQATTVGQIADAADVSESTFFRYFPTKEALFLEDDFDEAFIEAFRSQPPGLGPVPALREALRETFADITLEEVDDARQRAELVLSVPELRDAFAGQMIATVDQISDLIGERVHRPTGDLRVRALAGAVIGALMAVAMTGGNRLAPDYLELMDGALAELDSGFRFS